MMEGLPWKPNPEVEDQNIYCNVKLPMDSSPVERLFEGSKSELKIRRLRINPDPGCRAIRDGGDSVNHSEECRNSIDAKLKEKNDPRIGKRKRVEDEAIEREGMRIMEREERENNKRKAKEPEEEGEERNKKIRQVPVKGKREKGMKAKK